MFFSKAIVAAVAVVGAAAQRPTNTSICDYYTTALLKNNTAANQRTLLTLLVNTVVIGNYTQPNMNAVPGILANGTFNGTAVSLLPYFNGKLASTNRGGAAGVAVNFLDDGGAVPLLMNMPANGTSSNQYVLLTHLYQYFGGLLGCSQMGNSVFPTYSGASSQYNVHKFMVLSYAEVGYFITQVALAAASFGVAQSDIAAVGMALGSLFNVRCSPAMIVIPSQSAALQSICTGPTCPLAVNSTCASYMNVTTPVVATSTFTNLPTAGTGTAGGSVPTSTAAGGSGTSTSRAGAAATGVTLGAGAAVAALAAMLL